MNKTVVAALVAICTATQAGAMQNQEAEARLDRGHAVYQHVVLGNTSVPMPTETAASANRDARVPGPYAQYLIYYNGLSKERAIAQAALSGESPRAVRDPEAEPVVFTSYERYLRTVLGHSDADVLAHRSMQARQVAKTSAGAD